MSDSVVARVGQTAITEAAVDHWMPAMASGLVAPDPSTQQRQTPRQQALGFLISSAWLIGEAAERGLKPSKREIERRFAEKHASFPGGEAEFHEFLKATGQTVADIRFDVEAELASLKVRQAVASAEPKVTQTQITRYYNQHKRRYLVPERRYFDIDNLESEAAATEVRREVELGKSFARKAFHEWLDRLNGAGVGAGKQAIERAVFAARPNALGGPVRLYGDYSLFEVRRIVAAVQRPLAQVQSSIEQRLAAEQRRRALAEFVKTWRRKWIARTDCRAGHVAPGCKQYKGSIAPEAKL